MGRIVLIFLLVSATFISCFDPPELPVEPSISLKSYQFKYSTENNFDDSLIIELNFKDGDGNLGLTSYDTVPPYNEFFYYVDEENNLVKYDPNDPELPEYNCVDYEKFDREVNGKRVIDTFYVQRNEDHYNYFLEVLIKQEDNSFKPYNFLLERCVGGLNGRFFPLNTSGKERPLEGVLRYGVQSAFRVLFAGETIKLRISIQDRDLNRSNVVETDEIQIEA